MSETLGIPYAYQVEIFPDAWALECPICWIQIPLAEHKDFESFTGVEYATHYAEAHDET